jgi:hypothetical protein
MSATLQIIEIKKGSPYLPQVQALYESAFTAAFSATLAFADVSAEALSAGVFESLQPATVKASATANKEEKAFFIQTPV